MHQWLRGMDAPATITKSGYHSNDTWYTSYLQAIKSVRRQLFTLITNCFLCTLIDSMINSYTSFSLLFNAFINSPLKMK